MSWCEYGKVVKATPNLVVRAKFGEYATFPGNAGYTPGDRIQIARTPSGIIRLVESEHTPTTDPPPNPVEQNHIDYSTLQFPDLE